MYIELQVSQWESKMGENRQIKIKRGASMLSGMGEGGAFIHHYDLTQDFNLDPVSVHRTPGESMGIKNGGGGGWNR